MQREIKFRGKQVDTGEWVYGYYVKRYDNDSVIYLREIHNDKQFMVIYPVVEETVGQYTGLKDKNGKEIYEGDIFYVEGEYDNGLYIEDRSRYMYVLFDNDCASFFLADMDGTCEDTVDNYLDCEIIGNIYDNPELLQEVD